MEATTIPFNQTGYFSKLICDYLDEKKGLQPFYNRFPSLKQFKDQIAEKSSNYPSAHRQVLVNSLKLQYTKTSTSEMTMKHIESIANSKTFTVVTGHQLNLFTGPLYFLYKIVSTINLTQKLKQEYPDFDFVPIYWMATEDHDFDEINYFNYEGKKIQWNQDNQGAVGRLPLNDLEAIHELIVKRFGTSENAKELIQLFEQAYLGNKRLTEATRFLVNEIFKDYGLVIIDGDDADLKKLLVPYIEKDIFDNTAFEEVTTTIKNLEQVSDEYKIQVNPREINYFYLKDGLRERIIERDGNYIINDTEIVFSREELIAELENHPECFSPNVITRPLYQEVILPNLCYIGGGGELAYWLELKNSFKAAEISFPMLLLRNSVLLISAKQDQKIANLDLSIKDLFLQQNSLINKKIRKISNIDIDFSPQKKQLTAQFKALYDLARETDKSFLGAVQAQEVKQKKGLDNLEKRLLKAQKRKLKDHVIRLTDLQNELFPNYSLQERQENFSKFYLELGHDLIKGLFDNLDPLKQEFLVLRY
ncbi:bacillithiol biosynthesis cysteine-adding enzyme BshC [Croceivirga thetidis]|uniref:Putative cysteine ligase BshC n=1 Tax=Croceivirga thetidis TaxID=2721623 RepID=A0ABX1GV74_9FLAO|nr:bacillithiol biosynthesis cysteine-adding enzyme BshC [Croceivirga thetidis]NKI33529.1 bacillithiol biosynthesis cysteine-adding enzyme BshC [Croceivirga thetidis]